MNTGVQEHLEIALICGETNNQSTANSKVGLYLEVMSKVYDML